MYSRVLGNASYLPERVLTNGDDYILFWPLSHDGPRLLMSVHLAFQSLKSQTAAPSLSEFASQARHFAGLEVLLNKSLEDGSQRVAEAESSLMRARDNLFGAVDAFSQRLIGGQMSSALVIHDAAALQQEMVRLVTEDLRPPMQAAIDSAQPLRQWTNQFGASVAPHLESMRRLNTMVREIRSVILVIESDESAKLKEIKADSSGDILCVYRSEEALNMLGEPTTIKHIGQGEEKALMVALERADLIGAVSRSR